MRLLEALKRFTIALAVSILSVVVCIWESREQINVQEPLSIFPAMQNKFGFVMLLCVCWLWFEAVRMVVSPAAFHQSVHWPRVQIQRTWARMPWFRRV